jgi:hypothetical protein
VIVAHAIGAIRDLPIPGIFFLYGGAAVLGLSFIALGALWTEPHLEAKDEGSPLRPALQRILLSRELRVALGAISTALFAFALVAAFTGAQSVDRNLAPTLVWIVFWLGLVWVSVVLGDVWSALSPLRAVADATAALARRAGYVHRTRRYPARLGWWPAALLLFAFAALELVYPDPAAPRPLGAAMCVYAAITWAGMFVFGRQAWLENGEAFAVYYGLFARMAPFCVYEEDGEREILVRPPLVGLVSFRATPGTVPFVAVMLGSVLYDSISRTSAWVRFVHASLTHGAVRYPVEVAALAGCVVFVAAAYTFAVRLALVREEGAAWEGSLAPYFLASLVPIALVYSIAHYVSLLVIQGQYAIPLVSDPLGKGWNLLGSAHYHVNLTPLTTHEIWYIQVLALVTGHVLGLVLAHDRAVSLYAGRAALRSQYAMLALMVLYTVGGLYLLSRP